MQNIVLAGSPTIILIFLLQFILGLEPPHEPSWVRPLCFAVLALSVPLSVWCCWLVPGSDSVTVYEWGYRWRVSLSRWEWFPSSGALAFANLESFSYRSDRFTPEPSEPGNTTAEKFARILLDLNLLRHGIAFHLKNGKDVIVEEFFSRFDQRDLEHFLQHLATYVQPHPIEV
jgi:hypothetical protein